MFPVDVQTFMDILWSENCELQHLQSWAVLQSKPSPPSPPSPRPDTNKSHTPILCFINTERTFQPPPPKTHRTIVGYGCTTSPTRVTLFGRETAVPSDRRAYVGRADGSAARGRAADPVPDLCIRRRSQPARTRCKLGDAPGVLTNEKGELL